MKTVAVIAENFPGRQKEFDIQISEAYRTSMSHNKKKNVPPGTL